MAMDAPGARPEIMLTSGASGRVNALLSVSAWKSLVRLFNVLLLILLMPFRGGRRRSLSASEIVGKDEKPEGVLGGGTVKKGGSAGCGGSSSCSGGGPVVRLPAAIASKRAALASAVDIEVATRRAMAIRRVREDKDGAESSVRDCSLFVSQRGVTLFTQSWSPDCGRIRGVVVLLHGLNEHSGRYSDFAKQLNASGFKVYGLDWIGHGGSDGLHGYVHSLDDAVSDMKAFLDKVLIQNPGLPCFCFGHSTGGAIVLKAALDPKVESRIHGIVLTSPAVGVQPSHPIYTVLAPIVAFLLPKYQCGAANKKGAVVSRDPQALVAKYSDPLVYTGCLRVRTGYEILRISTYLQQNLKRLTVPFLVLHGTSDTVTDPEASERLYVEASSADKMIRLYEGLLHDLLFEPERKAIVQDILEWFNDRVDD